MGCIDINFFPMHCFYIDKLKETELSKGKILFINWNNYFNFIFIQVPDC